MKTEIESLFVVVFETQVKVTVKSPGRMNLIGEHLDYNGGIVMPAALNKAIYFAGSKRTDGLIKIFARDLNEMFEGNIHDIIIDELPKWAKHLLGVFLEIIKSGKIIKQGFNVCFGGNIPLGAGLSSSAAVETGFAACMNALFDLGLSKIDICKIAQNTEHNFIGVNCGIMDMFANVFAKSKHFLKLNCDTLAYEYLPFDTNNYEFLLFNSNVKHNLAESAYNTRRNECDEILSYFNQNNEQFKDLDLAQIQDLPLSKAVFNRGKYIIEEMRRVKCAEDALIKDDMQKLGALLYKTHDGLKDLYEVSCQELDFIVDYLKEKDQIFGARMMGGGFGGCVLALVSKNKKIDFKDDIYDKYYQKFGIYMEIYEVNLDEGIEVFLN